MGGFFQVNFIDSDSHPDILLPTVSLVSGVGNTKILLTKTGTGCESVLTPAVAAFGAGLTLKASTSAMQSLLLLPAKFTLFLETDNKGHHLLPVKHSGLEA